MELVGHLRNRRLIGESYPIAYGNATRWGKGQRGTSNGGRLVEGDRNKAGDVTDDVEAVPVVRVPSADDRVSDPAPTAVT